MPSYLPAANEPIFLIFGITDRNNVRKTSPNVGEMIKLSEYRGKMGFVLRQW